MFPLHLFKRTCNSLLEKGLRGTIVSFFCVIDDVLFEKRYGLDTLKIVDIKELDVSDKDKTTTKLYQGTRRKHFHYLMGKIDFPEKSVFVDVGSGKGKVLLIASEYEFERIVGIEFSPELCRIAEINVSNFTKQKKKQFPIEIYNINILDYSIGGDENIFYLYNPFQINFLPYFLDMIYNSLREKPRIIWLIFNNFNDYERKFSNIQFSTKKNKVTYGGTNFVVFKLSHSL